MYYLQEHVLLPFLTLQVYKLFLLSKLPIIRNLWDGRYRMAG